MANGHTPLEELFRRIKEKGYKLTPQRRAIAAAALGNPGASTALEVLERVRLSFPDISLDTVYRNLHLLTELGFLNRINLPGRDGCRFEPGQGGEHHHHLICLGCGRTECLPHVQCPAEREGAAAARARGFVLVRHTLELYGYCPACQAIS